MATSARKILIAMDGSKHSDVTFDWYVKYFYRESDFVTILFCAEHGALLTAPIPSTDPSLIAKLASEEEGDIIKLLKILQSKMADAKLIHPNMKGSVQRLSGRRPGELIVSQAEEQNTDIIITGSRGLSTLRRTVMGSVSQYVVHHARVPVLVVRLEGRN